MNKMNKNNIYFKIYVKIREYFKIYFYINTLQIWLILGERSNGTK